MRSVIPRAARVFTVAVAACLVLAGCGSGPTRAGAAAIVGDERIPVSEVDSWFSRVLAEEPGLTERFRQRGTMDDLARRLAGFRVRQELAERAARKEDLRVTPQQVTRRIERMGGVRRATQGKIFTSGNIRETTRSLLQMTELGRKYLPRTSVTFDYTQATTREDAEAKARRMARGPKAAARLIASDRATGVAAGRDRELRAAEAPRVAVGTPLFGAGEGTVVAFKGPQQRAGTWLIARITERDTSAPQAAPSARIGPRALQAFGRRLLGLTAERTGVTMSPRYGVWDPIGLTAAPEEGQTTGFRIPAGSRSA